MEYLIIVAVIFAAALIKGMSGFGFSLISLPILAFIIPTKTLIPVLTICNLLMSIVIVLQTNTYRIDKRFIPMLVLGIIGTIIGTMFLNYFTGDTLELLITIALILISLSFLWGFRFNVRSFRRGSCIAGLTSGFLAGSFSLSGPPLTLFLTSLGVKNQEFRSIFSWFNIVTSAIALIGYYSIGIVDGKTYKFTLLLTPILFVGAFLGKRINQKLSPKVFQHGTIIICVLSTVFLLIKVLR